MNCLEQEIQLYDVGAHYEGEDRTRFTAWAPNCGSLAVNLLGDTPRTVSLESAGNGYFSQAVDGVPPGTLYAMVLDEARERPDPAAFLQQETVHGASVVVDHGAFDWHSVANPAIRLEELVLYELHVGTFTPAGSFDAVIPRLDSLRELGVNALSIMPVAQFPGSRNWGYDGALLFAVQNSYGGPEGLKRLVRACHERGMAAILDVVYNHFGPEGNYLSEFGPYFTDRYQTPWGSAVNFDGAYSDFVRSFFLQNARYWLETFRMDGLRLDAVHAIFDMSAYPFLRELADAVDELRRRSGRTIHLIAESDLNDRRVVTDGGVGGYGVHAQWCDDYHHALVASLTGERDGYYEDFGRLYHVERAVREGYVYSGQYSRHRNRRHGNAPVGIADRQLVVFCQNHDQVGNRMLGERLASLVSFEKLKLAAGAVVLSPFVPMLFMGEEYGEQAPFLYFVSHGDQDLLEAVRAGRREEFRSFAWRGEAPDPGAEETFRRSVLNWESRRSGRHGLLRRFYQELLRLRREQPALAPSEEIERRVARQGDLILLVRRRGTTRITTIFSFADEPTAVPAGFVALPVHRLLDSADEAWGGPGAMTDERVRFIEDLVAPPHGVLVVKDAP